MRKGRILLLATVAGLLFIGVAVGIVAVSITPLIPHEEIATGFPPERFVPVDGRSVHVTETGDADEVLLFLHGFAASAYSFHRLTPHLSRDFRTVAIDLNGFGFSERPSAADAYTIEGQVETVLAAADYLDLRRFHVVGHSYGAAVAIRLARTAPERTSSLILVSPAPESEPPPAIWQSPPGRLLAYGMTRAVLSRPETFRSILAEAYHRDEVLTPQVAESYRARLLVSGLPDAFRGFSHALSSSNGLDLRLPEVVPPVLVFAGKHDAIVPLEWCRTVAESVPSGQLVVLEESGHSAPEEQPEEMAESIHDFLGTL